MKGLDLAALKRRILLMVSRGTLSTLVDSHGRQKIQLTALKNEVKSDVERVQQYGFTSNPLAGAQVIMLSVGGNRGHPVAIAVDDPRFRPTDSEGGESGLFHFEGHRIRLMQDGIVQIECTQCVIKASDKIRCETPILEVTGEVKDRCDLDGQTMSDMREIYNSHVHPENDSGGPTSVPNQHMGGAE